MGLRDRLRERQLPQATIGIRIDWSQDSYELHRRLEAVESMLSEATVAGADSVSALTAQAEELRGRVHACYEHLTVKALPAHELEALVTAHPPTEEQSKETPGATFNSTTFFPALLAACVEDGEDEEGWRELMESGDLAISEINALIATAMSLNDRSPSVVLGKGSTTTPS